MASRIRILSFLLILGLACSSSEPVVVQSPESDADRERVPDPVTEVPKDYGVTLDDASSESEEEEYPYLSSLSDTYFNRLNEIPEAYREIKAEIEEEEVDLFEGYRVQIYSGQNLALADTAAKRFRAWSAANIKGYQAETYTFFRAPFYRVHVGDFHNRQRAIDFSNLLKRRFRDSWVVYDRVNPFNVPSDTTSIIINR